MAEESQYWADFWKEYGKGAMDKDEQTQVLRTFNKEAISKELWEFTLKGLETEIEPASDESMLELCCGNGLISRYFSTRFENIVAVDVSEELVKSIDQQEYPNIRPVVSDIRMLRFDDLSFNKVIIYAGIQYLSLSETTELLEQVSRWLTPGGILFLGDIPDYNKRWEFYNNKEREAVYFNNLKEGKDVVGTWFDSDFFEKLATYAGYSHSVLLPQHRDLIYSNFRYDYKFVK